MHLGWLLLHMVWVTLNLAISGHMLTQQPRLRRFRLTCFAHHTHTVFSLFYAAKRYLYNHLEPWELLITLHSHLFLTLVAIGFLFSALMFVHVWRRVEKGDDSKGSQKLAGGRLTFVRVFRNLYSHFGATFILGFLGPVVPLDVYSLFLVHNFVLVAYMCVFGFYLRQIYEIEHLELKTVLTPLGFALVAHNVALFWMTSA
eukprot:gb/GEZN01019330.1/.p1 GENE.gb/GEZN01019330.1/~~gb/GEZN01019330.1/.p1  ORF type:complete len:223 (+),score=7.17 gb/GEZN01019330.1/:68-670(+)